MKIGLALRELHRSEDDLERLLLHVSDRHVTDHEVHHLARDLAGWSRRHVAEIAAVADEFGEHLDPEPPRDGPLARLREKGSALTGRTTDAGLLLLADLRAVYLHAAGVSVDWELVAQAAQGARRQELVQVTQRCHPETVRQMNWANGMLKEAATQVLLS